MAAKKRAAILFVLVTIVASSSAFASIPRSAVLDPPPIETTEFAPHQDLPLLTAHGYDAFLPTNRVSDEVARLEKTRAWGSRVGAELLRLPEKGLSRALRQGYAKGSSENAEEIRDLAIADLYLVAATESKTKLLTGFKAAPFIEPATRFALFRNRWYDGSTGTFLSPDPMSYEDSSNVYAFCAGDPINCEDPLGLALQTKNGGTNWLGNLGDTAQVRSGPWYVRNSPQTLSAGLDFFGNTLSELLMLDAWADANVVMGDSSRSAGERTWAATKGIGITAMNPVGGEIAGTTGKVLLKIPGTKTLASKIANSGVGRVLTAEVNPLRWFDDVGEAAGRGLNEGVAEAIQQLAPNLTRIAAFDAARSMPGRNVAYRAFNAKDAERWARGLGIEAKNPAGEWSLGEYIAFGSRPPSWTNDPWIATTTDLDLARAFNEQGKQLGIAAIDLNLVRRPQLRAWDVYPRGSGELYHFSIWQQELSVYQRIPREAIIGWVP